MIVDTPAGVPTVFVSYAAADRRWAQWVAWQLTACGFEPLLEAWHAVPGMNLVRWLDNALARADRLLLVLSESYLAETTASAQWQAGFSVADDRLVPVRSGCVLPAGAVGEPEGHRPGRSRRTRRDNGTAGRAAGGGQELRRACAGTVVPRPFCPRSG